MKHLKTRPFVTIIGLPTYNLSIDFIEKLKNIFYNAIDLLVNFDKNDG